MGGSGGRIGEEKEREEGGEGKMKSWIRREAKAGGDSGWRIGLLAFQQGRWELFRDFRNDNAGNTERVLCMCQVKSTHIRGTRKRATGIPTDLVSSRIRGPFSLPPPTPPRLRPAASLHLFSQHPRSPYFLTNLFPAILQIVAFGIFLLIIVNSLTMLISRPDYAYAKNWNIFDV